MSRGEPFSPEGEQLPLFSKVLVRGDKELKEIMGIERDLR
jgi:hypothetical protein